MRWLIEYYDLKSNECLQPIIGRSGGDDMSIFTWLCIHGEWEHVRWLKTRYDIAENTHISYGNGHGTKYMHVYSSLYLMIIWNDMCSVDRLSSMYGLDDRTDLKWYSLMVRVYSKIGPGMTDTKKWLMDMVDRSDECQ